MRAPTIIPSRVDLAIKLDEISELLEDALDLADQTRPTVRAPLHTAVAAIDEAKRRAAQ